MKILGRLRQDLNVVATDGYNMALHYTKSDRLYQIIVYKDYSFIIVNLNGRINTAYKLVEKFLAKRYNW